MKKFVAMVVQMGMIRKRSIDEYWSTDPYLWTAIFHSSTYFSRNRFVSILRREIFPRPEKLISSLVFTPCSFLRFADCENLADGDRLQRILPFLNQVRDLCLSNDVPSRNIAADETLMLYKGRLVSDFVTQS
jgi:hypothetical protein